jgi:thioredoxin reductase (NADPH)
MRLEGINRYENRQLCYDSTKFSTSIDKRVLILGGEDAALRLAISLHDKVKCLTLMHRTEKFKASDKLVKEILKLKEEGKLQLLIGRVKSYEGDDQLKSVGVTLNDKDKTQLKLALDQIVVLLGMSPKLDGLLSWGLALERNLICVDTASYQTSMTQVYAVGDINSYQGKKKLILCGFHEATLAAFAIKKQLSPDQKQYLQYTTTSPLMHKRLGLSCSE